MLYFPELWINPEKMSDIPAGDPLLLVGDSFRYLAMNAVRHGRNVKAVVHSSSFDLETVAPVKRVERPAPNRFDPYGLISATTGEKNSGIVYGPGFENHVIALSRLGDTGQVYGCSMETVRMTRDPESLKRASKAWNFQYPEIYYMKSDLDVTMDWVGKPVATHSGGVHMVAPGGNEEKGFYYQSHINGIPSSAAVVSDGSEAFVLGVVARICGDETFGAEGFTRSGGIFPHPFADEAMEQVTNIADALTLEFDIKGLWSFNFIYDGRVTLLSVHPRPSWSVGLVGAATWNDLLGLHIDSVTKKYSNIIIDPGSMASYYAEAAVRAKRDVVFTGARQWIEKGARDIPLDGTLITAGEPLLTVCAVDKTYGMVMEKLRAKASEVYKLLQTTETVSPL